MRADRLVSLILLLRARGRMSAPALASQLEVSTRTVLRDIEALSAAGVPVYAERGRHGGFALLPGFRTELTGLSHDETLALLAAGQSRGGLTLGLGSQVDSALRKVVDALPESHAHRAHDAAQRLLIEPEADLLARRQDAEQVPKSVMFEVRSAVVAGHKLRIRYEPVGTAATWRTVDPVGLVTVRGKGYLLAITNGADRTYRLSRIHAAQAQAEPAERPADVDLAAMWLERSARFRAGDATLTAIVRVRNERLAELADTALAVHDERQDLDGWVTLAVTFQDARHARWAVWQLETDAEAVAPVELLVALRDQAARLAAHYEHRSGAQ